MKLLLSLIVFILSIVSYSYSQPSLASTSSSSIDLSFKYLKTEWYPNGNGECTGELIQAVYTITNFCAFDSYSKIGCLEDGTIEYTIYKGQGCTGEISEIVTTQPNNCTNSVQLFCVEEMIIPDNSYQLYTTNRACPQTHPNWKSEIIQVVYTLTETCINNPPAVNYITCNSTIPAEFLFNSTDSCSIDKNWISYQYLDQPECSYGLPQFSNCGPPLTL